MLEGAQGKCWGGGGVGGTGEVLDGRRGNVGGGTGEMLEGAQGKGSVGGDAGSVGRYRGSVGQRWLR